MAEKKIAPKAPKAKGTAKSTDKAATRVTKRMRVKRIKVR